MKKTIQKKLICSKNVNSREIEPFIFDAIDILNELRENEIEQIEIIETPIEKKKNKTINVSLQIYKLLTEIRDDLAPKIGVRGSYNMAIQSILNREKELVVLKQEIKKLKEKEVESQKFIKDLLMKSVSSPSYPMMFQHASNNQAPSYIPSYINPPPPPKPKKPFHAPNTKDIKKDYLNEINQIFTGSIIKPSEIAKTTKPKHFNVDINEIKEDFEIPSIENISKAKCFATSISI